MKRLFENKAIILAVGMLSILALALLASIINSLEFKPEMPFLVRGEDGGISSPGAFPPVLAYLTIGLLFVLFILFLRWLSPEQRKKFLWGLARMIFFMSLAFLILSRFMGGEAGKETAEEATPGIVSTAQVGEPEPTQSLVPVAAFTPPPVAPWISYLVTLIILLAGVGIWWWLTRRKKFAHALVEELAGAAQSALDEIQAGMEWDDAVIECYARMSKTVSEQRGFKRRLQVTPSEFAVELERARLPREAVRRLTTLFERVRYGDKKSTQREIDEAINCLTSIVQACRETA